MRHIKLIIVFVLISSIMVGVCGCIENQDNEKIMEDMKSYAESKYNAEFTISYFQPALDPSYLNVLTLSDGNLLFNVFYRESVDSMYDDYPQALMDKKVAAYLKKQSAYLTEIDFCVDVLLTGDCEVNYAYVVGTDADELLHSNTLLKVILVLATPDDIASNKEKWFDVYNMLLTFEPKHIDFQIIQVDTIGSELEKMFANFLYLYDSEWEKFREIRAYLSVTDKEIYSPDNLVEGVK